MRDGADVSRVLDLQVGRGGQFGRQMSGFLCNPLTTASLFFRPPPSLGVTEAEQTRGTERKHRDGTCSRSGGSCARAGGRMYGVGLGIREQGSHMQEGV